MTKKNKSMWEGRIIPDWDFIRSMFPTLREITYINTASIGLIPDRSYRAVIRWLNDRFYGNTYWMKWYEEGVRAKELFAKLINASPEEIARIPNTSAGLNIIANSIKWKPGENIVTNDLEFPTNIFPWQVQARKYGLELRVVKSKDGYVRIEDYEKAVDDNTRAIAISWVEFSNGYVHDLKALAEIAHSVNAYLIVDAIQGTGSLKIDVREADIDFLACGGQKWLMGITASGFLYVKKSILDELEVSFGGWLGDKNQFEYSFREYEPADSARRFETGTPDMISYSALKESLDLILSIGIDNIQRRNLELARYLVEKIGSILEVASYLRDGEPLSPIVSFKAPDAKNLAKKLREKYGIVVAPRLGRIRVSPHFYNNEEDIDKLYNALRENL